MLRVFTLLIVVPMVVGRPRCGGTLTAPKGVLQSPNFPHKFAVPIHCEWIIDASAISTGDTSIYVYLTQVYVFEGLSFKEYQIYDQTYQLNGRDVHSVTESNVTKVSVLRSSKDYLVVTLKLDTIESTHLRVLDHLLDAYGFNITYEISGEKEPRPDSCTMMDCGFTGICQDHYTHFSCECFDGYEGKQCSQGPNSLCTDKSCQNGGTCIHVGDSAVRCHCADGFTGSKCEKKQQDEEQWGDCEKCFVICPFDGKETNVCKCPEGRNSTNSDTATIIGFTIDIKVVPRGNQLLQRGNLENQLAKVLKDNAGVSGVHLVSYQPFQTHFDVKVQMSGSRRDERRLKSMTNKWSERGYVANITLLPQSVVLLAPVTLESLQDITIYPSNVVHAGEDFSLSCRSIVHDPGQSSFRWFKDSMHINVSNPTSGKSLKMLEDETSPDVHVSQLSITKASPYDQGIFTCQVVDNGVQRCLTKRVDVRSAPRVWIEPMSLTVRKGENFTIKCFSAPTNQISAKYTYSWTKNKELLPIKTDSEHYEVLFPMGSILQVSTISKSTGFSCLVQDEALWAEQSILVNVIDTELIKTCPGERHSKLLWPETAPGSESLQECPPGYTGVARRSCYLREAGRPTWYLPDFGECLADELQTLFEQFQKVRLGYDADSPLNVLRGYMRYLRSGKELLPGEGFRILNLLRDFLAHVDAALNEEICDNVLDIIDAILQQKLAIINESQVILLQEVVKRQSRVFQSTFHRARSTIDVTLTKSDKTGFHVPQSAFSYPGWLSYKLHLALPRHYFVPSSTAPPNKSATLAVAVYRNLSAFLPLRSAIRLKDGIEMDYEVISNVVACWLLSSNGKEANVTDVLYTMEFQHAIKNSSQDLWKVQCAIADYASYGYTWDTQTCITRLLEAGRTRCICPRSGTYAVLLTMKPSFDSDQEVPVRQLVILVGCSTCTLLTAVAGLILAFYWFYRRSCLVFLKVQCCFSMFGSMLVFIYALWDEVPTDLFLTVMSFLESFLLTGLSSQLSNLLIIYSELVQLPRMKSIKQTVVIIITGAPMIAVFGNHMAHLTMNTRISSWWLLQGSLSFNIFVTCCGVIVVLYFLLLYIVAKKLVTLNLKFEKPSEALRSRMKLLKRSVLVFCSITATVSSSILYINSTENEIYHYVFSALSALMGTVIFFCYILCSETPVKQLLITRLKNEDKKDQQKSPDVGKHLKFFTKQGPEVENDSTPYMETRFTKEVMCSKYAEIGPTTFKTLTSGSFGNPVDLDTVAHSSGAYQHHQQRSENSPDLLGNKKFVELDLVASSSASHFFHDMPSITVTNASEELRQRPEGEEKSLPSAEIKIIHKAGAEGGISQLDDENKGENLDEVMVSITHDLNYLLNDKDDFDRSVLPPATSTLRRVSSKPHSLGTVFEREEPEEEVKVPEAITNLSRTNC